MFSDESLCWTDKRGSVCLSRLFNRFDGEYTEGATKKHRPKERCRELDKNVDILPMAEARGFQESLLGFPASRRCATIGFRRSWSYHLSTGRSCEPHSQNVSRSIYIAVMGYATFGTYPVTDIKRQGVEHMTTIETALRGRIPLVNPDKGTSIPLSFVCELPDILTPSYIANCFSEGVVLYHILDRKALDAYDLVLTYDLSRELVLIIFSPIGNPGVNTSDFQLSLPTVLPAFFLLSVPSLSFCQFLFIFGKELRVAVGVPIGSDNHGLQAQVKPYLLIHYRQVFDIFFYQDRDKVAIGTVFGDNNRSGFTALRQGARPVDIKGRIHLGKSKLFAVPGKGIGSIGSRLYTVFLVEGGILSATFKEVPECSVQVSQGLLQRDARYFREPGGLFLLFEVSQQNCQLIIVETFAALKESIGPLSQCPIIDVATTPESTSKDVSLLLSWVHSVLVCFLLFHALHASRYVVKSQAVRLSIPTARSRGSFGALDNVRPKRKSLTYSSWSRYRGLDPVTKKSDSRRLNSDELDCLFLRLGRTRSTVFVLINNLTQEMSRVSWIRDLRSLLLLN